MPKHVGIAVLQCVIKHAVPVVEQHHHVNHAEVQAHARCQQQAGTPFFFGLEIGQ
jgi:hypothetical protein